MRSRIVNEGVRIDGRGIADIRPLSAEVGIIATAHGTGLFQRGETQVLSVTTLGMPRMEQMLDTITTDERKRYMHHYNFAPFSTGETGRVGSPKRREIGHGALAERALLPVVPSAIEWPYTLRVVSDVLASNGSTSMASVCGSTLALMDAGVPIKAPVAGIAMGLVFHEGRYVTLTDILGAEDAFGDMDFKVAGTSEFVTALQLDTKIDGLAARRAQRRAGAGTRRPSEDPRRDERRDLGASLRGPRHRTEDRELRDPDRQDRRGDRAQGQGHQHDPAGDRCRHLRRATTAWSARSRSARRTARRSKRRSAASMLILDPPTAELGAIYKGRVVNITKFGAFVNILPGRDGLVHISKLGGGKRIDRVEDVLSLGMELEVKVDDIDQSGKLSLSLVGEDSGGDGGGGSNGGGGSSRGSDRGDRPERDRAPHASAAATTALPMPAPRAAPLPRRRSRTSGKTRPRPSSVTSVPRQRARVPGRPGGGESGGGARRRRPPRRR